MSASTRSLIWETDYINDFHIHLRQDDYMKTIVSDLSPIMDNIGNMVVMPNLIPPVINASLAQKYKDSILQASKTKICDFRMLLFIDMTHSNDYENDFDSIFGKKENKFIAKGVKMYPSGVTTNSKGGITVENIKNFTKLFHYMKENDLCVHIHGETPGVNPLYAEEDFLKSIDEIEQIAPGIKIVLEHLSTKKAVDYILSKGDNITATITPQHLLVSIHTKPGNREREKERPTM